MRSRAGRFVLRFVVAAVALCASFAVRAEVAPTESPFLWRIAGEKPSYLYGTIHLPDERVTTLPASLTEALDGSDAFFAEIPLDSQTQMKMAPAMVLPGDQTIRDLVPDDLYARVESYLGSKVT